MRAVGLRVGGDKPYLLPGVPSEGPTAPPQPRPQPSAFGAATELSRQTQAGARARSLPDLAQGHTPSLVMGILPCNTSITCASLGRRRDHETSLGPESQGRPTAAAVGGGGGG